MHASDEKYHIRKARTKPRYVSSECVGAVSLLVFNVSELNKSFLGFRFSLKEIKHNIEGFLLLLYCFLIQNVKIPAL